MANEQADPPDNFQFVANEYSTSSNWVLLAPYGDWPNALGMQRFHRTDAESIVHEFGSFANSVTRMIGLPFYVGHPDHPLFSDRHRDTKAYGRIKALEAREEGLFGNVEWNKYGKELIEAKCYHGHSVNWKMKPQGNVFRPVSLKSVGFTNEPNLPVPPVLAANQKIENMKKIAVQLGLPETATEEQISQKLLDMANEAKAAQTTITTLKAVETEYAGKKSEFANEVSTLKGQVSTLNQQVTNLTNERDAAKTNFANERKERSKILLDAAVKEGRITAAERAEYETNFANEGTFETKMTKLGSAKSGSGIPINKSKVDGDRRRVNDPSINESHARAAKVREFVNAKMKAGLSYNDAFSAVQTEHADLFANMVQPGQEE